MEDNINKINISSSITLKETLKILINNKINLIIMDTKISNQKCYELLTYLETIEEVARIPIVLIGYKDNILCMEKAFEFVDVIDFIDKPINEKIFCSKIKAFIKIFKEKNLQNEQLLKKESIIIKENDEIKSIMNQLDRCTIELNKHEKIDEKDINFIKLMNEKDVGINLKKLIKKNRKEKQ